MLTTSDLLNSWEQGLVLSLPGRAERLLGLMGVEPETAARLSVGQRDSLLMALRRSVFSSRVVGVAVCPRCGQWLETTFDLEDVRVEAPGDPGAPIELSLDGCVVQARPPTSGDLLAVTEAGAAGEGDARMALIERCVLHSRLQDTPVPAGDLPANVLTELGVALGQADPQADVHLAFECFSCGHAWSAVFDILVFFWAELDSWCQRLLAEVHALACAYAWTEAEILALSSWRRSQYLKMVRW